MAENLKFARNLSPYILLMADSKKLVILGGGESGTGAALLGKAKGFDVFLSDKGSLADRYRHALEEASVEYEEGMHSADLILNADLVVKSPGIPDTAPLVAQILSRQIPVLSEIEFAFRYTGAKMIAITGSNGKTTTTLLIYHLLKQAGLSVGLAGNVGDSLARQVVKDDKEMYVVELSSFQLDNMYTFHANTAILLNITPDHLDRYAYNFDNYVNSKFRITRNQTENDHFIFFQDNEPLRSAVNEKGIKAKKWAVSLVDKPDKGGYLANGKLVVNALDTTFEIDTAELPLQGPHNAINMIAAIIAASAAGLSSDQIRNGLYSFRNAPHRLEEIAKIDGVTYVNDSKATNVDSVYYALSSFNRPVILILGGVDKGNDYSQIEPLVRGKVKGIIAMGKDNAKLTQTFSGMVPLYKSLDSLKEAVSTARQWAQADDVVLLSPACASFDLFTNYMDRGDQFRNEVLKMKKN